MGYLQIGGFVVPVGLNGVGDTYYNPCVPNTVAVNERVTVKVSVTVTPRNTVQLTVEPSILWLPQSASVQNPVRNRLSVTEGVPAAEVVPIGYQTLEEYVQNNNQNVSVTVTVNQQDAQQVSTSVLNELSKEVTTEVETSREDVRIEQSGEESLILSQALKSMPEVTQRQVLQRAQLPITEVENLARTNAQNAQRIMDTYEAAQRARVRNSLARQQVSVQVRNC